MPRTNRVYLMETLVGWRPIQADANDAEYEAMPCLARTFWEVHSIGNGHGRRSAAVAREALLLISL